MHDRHTDDDQRYRPSIPHFKLFGTQEYPHSADRADEKRKEYSNTTESRGFRGVDLTRTVTVVPLVFVGVA